MSDVTHRRWVGSRRVRGALAGAAVGGLMMGMVPASPAAATGPRAFVTPNCTPESPYSTNGHVEGFPPNDTFYEVVVFYRSTGNSAFDGVGPFTTDANGVGVGDGGDPFPEPGPLKIGVLFFHDRDGGRTYTHGDDVIANLIVNIDQPCTGAVAQPK
jgi:hypothetical protein